MNELLLTIHPLRKRLFGWIKPPPYEVLPKARLSFKTDYRAKNEGKKPVIFKRELKFSVALSESWTHLKCNWVLRLQCKTWLMPSTLFYCLINICFSHLRCIVSLKRFLWHFRQVLQGQLQLWISMNFIIGGKKVVFFFKKVPDFFLNIQLVHVNTGECWVM